MHVGKFMMRSVAQIIGKKGNSMSRPLNDHQHLPIFWSLLESLLVS